MGILDNPLSQIGLSLMAASGGPKVGFGQPIAQGLVNAQKIQKQNQTEAYLRQNHPEIAEMVANGLDVGDAFTLSLRRDAEARQEKRDAAADAFRQHEAERQQANWERTYGLQERQEQRLAKSTGSDETFYGNPIPIQTPQGVQYGQVGSKGSFKPINIGEGNTFAPPTTTVDTGTEKVLVDKFGNRVGSLDVNNEQAAADTARGKGLGENQANRQATAVQDTQAAENALAIINDLRTDPNRQRGTGGTSLFNGIPGTAGYDYQNKVQQAKSGAFLTAIQQMRGLGALSNTEGEAATAATNRMDTATSEEAFLSALDDYEKIVRQALARAQKNLPAGSATGSATTPPANASSDPLGLR